MAILDLLFRSPGSRTKIGALSLDLLVSEELTLEGGVTKYPVESGSIISDHIVEGETSLRISGEISSAEGYYMRSMKVTMIDALEMLEAMHRDRAEITIVTGLRQYEHMGMERLNAVRSNDAEGGGNWLRIGAEFTKIRKVSSRTAEISEQKTSGATKGRAGATARPNTQNSTATGQSGQSTGTATGSGTTRTLQVYRYFGGS